MTAFHKGRFRSRQWFDNPENPAMTALYLERYQNQAFTLEELQSGKPIIGIAQTGSDLVPCNRVHVDLSRRVRDGIRVRAVTLGDDEPAGEVVIPNLEEAYLATLGEVEERRRRDAQPKTAAAHLLDVASWRS